MWKDAVILYVIVLYRYLVLLRKTTNIQENLFPVRYLNRIISEYKSDHSSWASVLQWIHLRTLGKEVTVTLLALQISLTSNWLSFVSVSPVNKRAI